MTSIAAAFKCSLVHVETGSFIVNKNSLQDRKTISLCNMMKGLICFCTGLKSKIHYQV